MTLNVECECGEVIAVKLVGDDICQYQGTPLTDHKRKHRMIGNVTFMCLCGARHITGPAVYAECAEGMRELRRWWADHRGHCQDNLAN